MRQTLRLLLVLAFLAMAAPVAYGQAAPEVSPDGFALTAAYPNPFNPSTSFSLSVEARQEVKVQVFNLLGQPVRRLFEGTMEAGETRTFTFEAGDLPSGIYLYRTTGETFTATRQVTLLK